MHMPMRLRVIFLHIGVKFEKLVAHSDTVWCARRAKSPAQMHLFIRGWRRPKVHEAVISYATQQRSAAAAIVADVGWQAVTHAVRIMAKINAINGVIRPSLAVDSLVVSLMRRRRRHGRAARRRPAALLVTRFAASDAVRQLLRISTATCCLSIRRATHTDRRL